MLQNQSKMKPGHLEIHGETIAQFELFDAGFNTYSRYLDVDKIDLIIRFNTKGKTRYKEIQVKYGRTYIDKFTKNQKTFFSKTSWKIVDANEFANCKYKNLFIIYVLGDDSGYKGDLFVFPINEYNNILKNIISTNIKSKKNKQKKDGRKLYISLGNDDIWYIWKKINFSKTNKLTDDYVFNIQKYYRNFSILKK